MRQIGDRNNYDVLIATENSLGFNHSYQAVKLITYPRGIRARSLFNSMQLFLVNPCLQILHIRIKRLIIHVMRYITNKYNKSRLKKSTRIISVHCNLNL